MRRAVARLLVAGAAVQDLLARAKHLLLGAIVARRSPSSACRTFASSSPMTLTDTVPAFWGRNTPRHLLGTTSVDELTRQGVDMLDASWPREGGSDAMARHRRDGA